MSTQKPQSCEYCDAPAEVAVTELGAQVTTLACWVCAELLEARAREKRETLTRVTLTKGKR